MECLHEDDELDETEDARVKLPESRATIQPLAIAMMVMSALVLRILK